MKDTQEYVNSVLKTESNDFIKINERLSIGGTQRLLHAAVGMQTESAEFTDMLKKHIFYGKPLDPVNLKEEIGDCLWYIAIAVHELGEEDFLGIMATNVAKLRQRYGNKFEETQAEHRDLAQERAILER